MLDILLLFFLRMVVRILVLRSTISLCRIFILTCSEACFWEVLSLLDQMVCIENLSRVFLSCCGRMSSTYSIFWLYFLWNTVQMLSRCLISRFTYSIKMSSPVIIIFCFFFSGSSSFLDSSFSLISRCTIFSMFRSVSSFLIGGVFESSNLDSNFIVSLINIGFGTSYSFRRATEEVMDRLSSRCGCKDD